MVYLLVTTSTQIYITEGICCSCQERDVQDGADYQPTSVLITARDIGGRS